MQPSVWSHNPSPLADLNSNFEKFRSRAGASRYNRGVARRRANAAGAQDKGLISREESMTEASRLERMADDYEVQRVRRIWAFSRDHCDWEGLKSCFHPDATVLISWYSGSASGFVEKSKEAAAKRGPQERSQHWLGNARTTVHGNRATLEMDVQILSRDFLDGHLFDCTCYGRFFDLFEKRDGAWRISKWTCIYDKDRLDPVLPAAIPASFWDGFAFRDEDNSCAFMQFRQGKKGRVVPPGLIMGGSEAEHRVKREGDAWLAGATP
jgi:hypothetical protein